MAVNPLPPFKDVLTATRKLGYFGSELELRRHTAFQFLPDVLGYLATGVKLKRELERANYDLFLALTAAERAERTGGSLRKPTLATITRTLTLALGPLMSINAMKALPPERRSAYRVLFRGRHHLHKALRRVVVRLAAEERLAVSLDRSFGTSGHAQRYGQAMGPSIVQWHLIAGSDAAIHMDRILMHVAWIDRDLCMFGSKLQNGQQQLVDLAAPHQHPMRTWFDRLLLQTHCRDLPALEKLLAARAVSVPSQSLRHYAAGTQPLRHHRAMDILRGCAPSVDYESERLRFWCARLLTFVQELLQAMPEEFAPNEARARALVHDRLVHLRNQPARRLL